MSSVRDSTHSVRANPAVGARLKELRLARNLSQRQLARDAGVTNATISQIEQGRSSPSVASLRKIVDALGLKLVDFFSSGIATRSPFERAPERVDIGSGGISMHLVGGGQPGRALQMLVETYSPGADTGVEMLEHAGEECGVVLAGRIEITVGELTRSLGPGDGYYFASSQPHRFRNLGDEPCELVSAATPATF